MKISREAFHSRNRPPNSSTRSRPLMPSPTTLNRSVVSPITQLRLSSSASRVSIAKPRPSRRARLRRSGGRRLTRMEMKMMLSMPSTISRAVGIAKATQAL
jgi:hypothetical protein